MSLTVQPLPTSLLTAAVALDQQVFGGFWSQKSYQKELTRPSSDLVGAWFPSVVPPTLLAMGCAWSILDEAHIVLVAVHPHYRQHHLGLAILVKLLDAAHQRGADYATLEVGANNTAAIALYTKLGFTLAGCRPNYYPATGEDALVMWRASISSVEFKHQLMLHWQAIEQRWQHLRWEDVPQL
jgi:ribosomal-protein-alanine N-acetyltransferase